MKFLNISVFFTGFLGSALGFYTFGRNEYFLYQLTGAVMILFIILYYAEVLLKTDIKLKKIKSKIKEGDSIFLKPSNVQFKELTKEFEIKKIKEDFILIEDKRSKTLEQINLFSLYQNFCDKDFNPFIEV